VSTLVTKRTTKKKYINKKLLSTKLDNAANNVIKRGVYIVANDEDGFYCVKNYFNNKDLIKSIPFAKVAKAISISYNKKETDANRFRPSVDKIEKICNLYHKHKNDILFYEHTIAVTTDATQLDVTEARLYQSKSALEFASDQLSQI
jgi:hypothetical protein|tara:strand:+ start:5088 stop:5528 length:441 start_codon:yes stop_codon:yes gene_type:complete